MRWSELIEETAHLACELAGDADLVGIEYDSRRVTRGAVFVAMRGGTTDGNVFLEAALGRGASAVVTDSPEAFGHLALAQPAIPRMLVAHGRTALAQASAAFFGHPERRIRATGVTGTNGKTTTAFLIERLLQAAGRSTILVGTIENHVAGEVRPSAHTTPESRDLLELMAEGAGRGATELAIEVSSHALDQGRVAEIGFDTAVFTNLTRDHLDYHGTMERYFAAKKLLFDGLRYPAPRVSVLNADDPHTPALLLAARQAGSEILSYGLGRGADWRAEDLCLSAGGAEFTLVAPAGEARVRSRLAGEVNVLNLLAALAASCARGVSFDRSIAAVPELEPVPGRFEAVDAGQPFAVLVDYAHTDDALRNLTALARQLVNPRQGRVLTLFGCGGDRDRSKRPKMGEAAGKGSDFVVITSDNPRSEEPGAILEEIVPGVVATGVRYRMEPDRAAAIALILSEAEPGDVVVLAGKGHEQQQILREGAIFFDDRQVALSALRELGYGGGQ